MKVLVVGGGGREHALAWKLSASPRVTALYCAPGNPGIAQVADLVPIKADDLPGILKFVRRKRDRAGRHWPGGSAGDGTGGSTDRDKRQSVWTF